MENTATLQQPTIGAQDDSRPSAISLNLTDHYARTWGTWEGVREIVQNWHDGLYEGPEDLSGDREVVFEQKGPEYLAFATLKGSNSNSSRHLLGYIHYDWLGEKIFLVNKHTSLKRKILLLGYSKKALSKSVIGQFGEGLKVGALALVREGRVVTMTTGNDLWKFELRNDEQLGEKVLTVYVKDRNTESGEDIPKRTLEAEDTSVRISLEEDHWKRIRTRFLFLHPPKDFVVSEIGRLILDEDLRSQLFVKGTWVADLSKEDLYAGVDFINLNIDRDRNAVPKPSEIDHMVSCMWMQALKFRPDLTDKYYDLLMNGKYRDVRQALTFGDPETLALLSGHFFNLYGSEAYAVSSNAADNDLKVLSETLHKKIVICNETILRILLESGSQLPVDKMLTQTEHQGVTSSKVIPFMELIGEEREVLRHAVKMINSSQICPAKLEQIDVVDIDVEKKKNGVYRYGDRFKVPRWMLNREVAHYTVHGAKSESDSQDCLCTVTHLALSLVNANPVKLNVIGYDNLRENTGTSAWVFNLLYNMANQVCGSAKEFCLELHQTPNVDDSTRHSECIDREREFQEQLRALNEQLGTLRESASKDLSSVTEHMKELENELVQWELKFMNEDEKIRKHYEKEVNMEKAKQVELLQNVEYWKNKYHQEQRLKEEVNTVAARKEKSLLEELNHYVKECQKRTDTLRKVVGEKLEEASADESTKSEASNLKDFLKVIAEDLQESRFLCNVCFQHRKTHMILSCGHYSFCQTCVEQLAASGSPFCPLCKCEIDKIIRVYE